MNGKSQKLLLEEADSLKTAGRYEEAIRVYEEAMKQGDMVEPLQFMSAYSLHKKDYQVASSFLERLIKLTPKAVEIWQGLGVSRTECGDGEGGLKAFQKALRLNTSNPTSWLYLGSAYSGLGLKAEAQQAFSFAVDTFPKVKLWPDDSECPEPLRSRAREANILLQEVHDDIIEISLEAARKSGQKGNMERIRQMIWRKLYARDVPFVTLSQQPLGFYVPGLDPRPWFERDEFDWVEAFEANWEDLAAEVQGELKEADLHPYIKRINVDEDVWGNMVGNADWGSLHLYDGEVANEDALARFPKIRDLIDHMPLFRIDGNPVEVLISVLQPKTKIPPHFGMSNCRLTVHLPLVVPEGCGLKAGDETRPVEAGKTLLFDDSFRHEAWNDSNDVRINLIVEAWHPDVTEAEKAAIEQSFIEYENWMKARDFDALLGRVQANDD